MSPLPPRLFALATLAVALAVPSFAAAQFGYEELARTTALTAADDYRIGKGYFDMMRWLQGSTDDPAARAPLDAMLRRLVRASDRPDTNVEFVLVPTPELNAAALPGGFLMINQGIVDALPEAELAFVIGHEIAHVQLRHFATTMNMTHAMEVLGLAEEEQAEGDREGAESQADALGKMARSYARQLELEADLYGMLYAMRAGYPAASGVAAMQSMARIVGDVPPGMEHLADHPSFADRINELQRGITTIEETFGLFEAGVGFSRQTEYDGAIAAFQQFLALFPKSAAAWSNLGACYLRKAILSMPDDPWHDDVPVYVKADVTVRAVDTVSLERARDAFQRALAIDPNRDAALANLAVLARREGDRKGAAGLLAKAQALDPNYVGYHNNVAVLAASGGDWKAADKAFAVARKADGSAAYVTLNEGVAAGLRGNRKGAIAAWRRLEASPQYGDRARVELVALGEKAAAETARPASAGEGEGTIAVAGSPSAPAAGGVDGVVGAVKLGMTVDQAKSSMGTPDVDERMEDGYFAYLQWFDRGLSAMFIDDVASGFEVFEPGDSKTGAGVGRGSSRAQVLSAYGEPTYSFQDPDMGLETLLYDTSGLGFYLAESGVVTAFSVWNPAAQ